MKPVTPLRAENGLKSAVLCEQRCQRFQTRAARSSQRCRRFHLVAVIHLHWCHWFQARRSAGVGSLPPRKVARNSIGRSFNKVGKRCNSNDHISEFERDVGELRAKLRVGSGMRGVRGWVRGLGARDGVPVGAWLRCPWAVAGPGRASSRRAERSSRRGRRAGGPPPTGTQSSPDRRKCPRKRHRSQLHSNMPKSHMGNMRAS